MASRSSVVSRMLSPVGIPTRVSIDLPRQFDLIDYLPTPGKQMGSNCVAWTIAHVVYTCQIAQERRRRPTDAAELFSPSFIDEQLEDGNSGIQVNQAIDLVEKYGCATLATMPSDKTQASAASRLEAKNYRARQSVRATNLAQIKTSIYEGCPVVLTVRMGGDFRSDTALGSPYLWQNESDPKADYHALAAVGFDDDKHSLLVMNSWGTQWKDGGFCWVSYVNFERIDLEGWCADAHVVGVKKVAPHNVSMTSQLSGHSRYGRSSRYQRRAFQLRADRKVYEGNRVISPDEWVFDDIACNRNHLFALGRDQTIYRMNDEPSMGCSWTRCDTGLMSKKNVMMIAGDRLSVIWVLTRDQELFQYNEARGDWGPVTLPLADVRPIDLRSVGGEIHATTLDGSVFVYQQAGDWFPSFGDRTNVKDDTSIREVANALQIF